MSRIGKLPIVIPEGVLVEIDNRTIKVKKDNHELTHQLPPGIKIKIEEQRIIIDRLNNMRLYRSLHGLTRSLIFNMVKGVSEGFEKVLEINGVGYRADLKGKDLELNLGFSHPIKIEAPEGIEFIVEKQKTIKVKGADKQLVGKIASEIRSLKKPEPYKGKGIKYIDEYIRRKVGKAGAAVGGK
ncbi:MAG: 50S ribosomal protein L6 [Atribacterota bacterium]|jgi:large subunit ribosomal protein L6|nr:50S ribosomal protein L6 [Atribacterota bacterium]MDY0382172.1 50S ribosomal protein L6 [Atribacterota bacterium]